MNKLVAVDIPHDTHESELAGSYPVRGPVWWGRRGDAGPHPDIAGVSGRFVVLRHRKVFGKIEGILAKLMRAPKELRRPLDDMNSLLWELCDGQRTFQEICHYMDATFEEKVAPVAERCDAAMRLLGERGFMIFCRTPFEGAWPIGPGVDHEGVLSPSTDLDVEPLNGECE